MSKKPAVKQTKAKKAQNSNSPLHRVQKILSNRGYCSRRKAEQLIEDGKVKVNGKIITIGDKARETDKITVNNKEVKPQRRIYLMFHKPLYCVTALHDLQHKTVMDYIKIKERVFPVGRLDYNSSGLLLLTNDGDFANQIMHPRNEIKKTYLVRTDRPLSDPAKKKLEAGVTLEDGSKVRPAKISMLAPKIFEVTIHEGKNRIIRRMLQAVDYKVRELKRIRVGHLGLGTLKLGRYRTLTKKDLDRLFSVK